MKRKIAVLALALFIAGFAFAGFANAGFIALVKDAHLEVGGQTLKVQQMLPKGDITRNFPTNKYQVTIIPKDNAFAVVIHPKDTNWFTGVPEAFLVTPETLAHLEANMTAEWWKGDLS